MPALAKSSNVTQGGTLRWKRLAILFTRSRSWRIAASRAVQWFGMLSVLLRSFIFGPFLPVLFGATNGERSVSGGLHETERSEVKEAWGYPSGGGRAQVGRSGRQAKRCPNMRAEGTEETAGLASSNPYRR